MHTDQLAYFLHAAETGSINAVAQKFFITQQAVNAQLKKLEAELEVPLFNRSTKGVSLTPQGHLFIPYAQNILKEHDEALCELQRFGQTEATLMGTLSIFSASILSDLFLPTVISRFIKLHPRTSVIIIDVNSGELLSYLLNDYCELALFSANKNYIMTVLAKAKANIKLLPLLDDTLVLCIRPDHPLMRYKELNSAILTEYADKNYFKFSLYQVLPIAVPELTYAEAISTSTSSNVDLHKKLIVEDVALAYMSKLAYQYKFQNEGFACIPMLDSFSVCHCLLYRDDLQDSNNELLRCFLDFAQKQFQRRFFNYQYISND